MSLPVRDSVKGRFGSEARKMLHSMSQESVKNKDIFLSTHPDGSL
jgi:hypothetical protein